MRTGFVLGTVSCPYHALVAPKGYSFEGEFGYPQLRNGSLPTISSKKKVLPKTHVDLKGGSFVMLTPYIY